MRSIARDPLPVRRRRAAELGAGIIPSVMVAVAAAAGALAVARPAAAQSLASRVASVGDATMQLRFASRPGVCGDGRGSMGTSGGSSMRRYSSSSGYDEGWCVEGPVRVVLHVRGGEVSRAMVYVGGNDPSPAVRDFGTVAARDAANYFLSLARRTGSSIGDDAILAAVLADSVEPWPALFEMARADNTPRDTRASAGFWLSRAAAAAVNRRPLFGGHERVESERDQVRNAAIFALSQQPRDEGVPALIRIVRGNDSPEVRDKALFWLGQSGDSRALDLFADLLGAR